MRSNLGASAIILVDNHPSGSPDPSRQDIAITKDIARSVPQKLGIALHDHIIIGGADYRSLRRDGVFFDGFRSHSHLTSRARSDILL